MQLPIAERQIVTGPVSGARQDRIGQVGSGVDLARSVQNAGQALAGFADAEDRRLAELDEAVTRSRDSEAALNETAQLYTGEGAFFTLRGADAAARAPALRAELDAFDQELLSQAQGSRQTEMLTRALEARRVRREGMIARHEAQETIAYNDASLAGGIAVATAGAARLAPSSDEFAEARANILLDLDQLIDRRGLDGPAGDALRLDTLNTLNRAVVDHLMDTGRGGEARAFALERQDEFTDLNFLPGLEREVQAQAAFEMGDVLFEQAGGDEARALEMARQLDVPPDRREMVERRITTRGSQARTAERDQEDAARDEAYRRLAAGENPEDWSAADRLRFARWLPSLESAYRSGANADAGEARNAALWLSYVDAGSFGQIDTVAEVGAGRMSFEDARIIAARQSEVRRGQRASQGTPEAALGRGVTLVNRNLGNRLQAAYPGTRNAALRQATEAYAYELIANATADGRDLTADEGTAIIDQAIRMAAAVEGGSRSRERMFTSEPGTFADATIIRQTLVRHLRRAPTPEEIQTFRAQGGFVYGDIPAAIRSQIADDLEAETGTRGPFTNDQYVRAYMDYLENRE